MDRRAFFGRVAHKAAETALKAVDQRARSRAQRWLRPPHALAEVEFLLTCTRCTACAEACPHSLIFPLPARLGPEVAGTPALDLLNRGCRLCADWPCVAACEPQALRLPEGEEGQAPPLPSLARVSIDEPRCLPYQGPECGACVPACPVPGALRLAGERPVIDAGRCVGCALCREACVVEPKAVRVQTPQTADPPPAPDGHAV